MNEWVPFGLGVVFGSTVMVAYWVAKALWAKRRRREMTR